MGRPAPPRGQRERSSITHEAQPNRALPTCCWTSRSRRATRREFCPTFDFSSSRACTQLTYDPNEVPPPHKPAQLLPSQRQGCRLTMPSGAPLLAGLPRVGPVYRAYSRPGDGIWRACARPWVRAPAPPFTALAPPPFYAPLRIPVRALTMACLRSQAIMTAVLLCTRSELVASCRCLLAASHSALVCRKSPGVRASWAHSSSAPESSPPVACLHGPCTAMRCLHLCKTLPA